MTEEDMEQRFRDSDPSILLNCDLGRKGRRSLRVLARQDAPHRIGIALEWWEHPAGSPVPIWSEDVMGFREVELDRLIWALDEIRRDVRRQGRPTGVVSPGEVQPEDEEKALRKGES
jgi:hypothetical protein